MADAQIEQVKTELKFVEEVFRKLLKILPSFDLTNEKILPYGLKPHTRSVSWLVEQVITQQTKFNAKQLGLTDAKFDFPDTCLHDCELIQGKKSSFVNVKIHKMGGKESDSDIAALTKLVKEYKADNSYNLIDCVVGLRFDKLTLSFDADYLRVFSPQFLPNDLTINLSNSVKIQASYDHKPVFRSRSTFLTLLADSLTEAKRKRAAKDLAKKK